MPTPTHSRDSYSDNELVRARRERRRRQARQRRLQLAGCALLLLLVCIGGAFLIRRPETPAPQAPEPPAASTLAPSPALSEETPVEEPAEPEYTLHTTENTASLREDFPSQYVILADLDSGEILVQREMETVINPASMTKILTLLVAMEQGFDPNATFTMTVAESDYCFANQCSVVGYINDEVIPAVELPYGCILCSGADATLGLAQVTAGSHEAFVDLMNAKLEELGLSDTAHFTNSVGLYDEDHHCTVADMALILKAAWENEASREVLSTPVYQSVPTEKHPEGQVLSNLYLRRIGNQDTGDVTVLCAKTGYVPQSGFCAASLGQTPDGRTFLCVTGKSTGTWQSIYDHAELYRTYCK